MLQSEKGYKLEPFIFNNSKTQFLCHIMMK